MRPSGLSTSRKVFSRYSFSLPTMTLSDVQTISEKIYSAMGGSRGNVHVGRGDDVDAIVGTAGGVRMDYNISSDSIRLIDLDLSRSRDTELVSEEYAKTRAQEVLSGLEQSGVLVVGDFRMSAASLQKLMMGTGSSDGALSQDIKEYQFFVRREIDGVPVNNGEQMDLGLSIAVHRSGSISRVEISALGLSWVKLGEIEQDKDEQFLQDLSARYATAIIEDQSIRYSIGFDGGPRRVFRVSESFRVEGRQLNSRWNTVYYPLGGGEPTLWPTLSPDDVGDPRQ